MSRIKVLALGFLGIAIPVVLAMTAFLISRSTIGSAGTVPSITHTPFVQSSESPGGQSASPSKDGKKGPGGGIAPATSQPQPTATSTDDNGGRCSEPEHANDPECDSDNSGKGGGGGGGDDSSNSGHGSGDD
jgi:hypothetical protein